MNPPDLQLHGRAANDGLMSPYSLARHPRQVLALSRTLALLLDQVASETLQAISPLPPIPDRQWIGLRAYLNACLQRPAIQTLTSILMGSSGAARIRRRHDDLATLLSGKSAIGNDPDNVREPRTLAAMVLEAELAEHERRGPAKEYRDLLRSYLGVRFPKQGSSP